LEEADMAFDKGKYAEAAHRYEICWQGDPWGERSDEVLFHWALSLALMPNANTDWTRVTSVLNQLITQHPKSSFLPQANAILAIANDVQKREQENKQLKTDLDKLKQIDAERRKRP
jgi:hypothetical protein